MLPTKLLVNSSVHTISKNQTLLIPNTKLFCCFVSEPWVWVFLVCGTINVCVVVFFMVISPYAAGSMFLAGLEMIIVDGPSGAPLLWGLKRRMRPHFWSIQTDKPNKTLHAVPKAQNYHRLSQDEKDEQKTLSGIYSTTTLFMHMRTMHWFKQRVRVTLKLS